MQKARFGFIFLIALLALLPAPDLAPAVAQAGGIQKIILKGETLPGLSAPSEEFSPTDVNDSGLVVFYGKDAGSTCGVFTGTPGGGAPTAVVTDGFLAPQGPLYMCSSIGQAPLTNTSGHVAFAAEIGIAGSPRAIYVSTAPGSATKVVMQNETPPDGGNYGVPTLLDFNDDGDVLFRAPVSGGSPAYPEAIFLGQAGGPAAKVVAVNDNPGGDTVSALGDASMNNAGHVAFQAVQDSTDTILRWDNTLPYVEVVKEGDEWKLGEAYSGGEAHHAHTRFTDTFTSVSEPRINDNDQVSYYAQTAGGKEGFFIATPGSEYEQAKQATEDDPSVLGVEGFNSFGGRGRHNLADDGDIVVPGSGGDPTEGVLVFPWFHKVVIQREIIPGGGANDTYQSFVEPALSESGGKVAFKAGTSPTTCPSAPCQGVFGGTIELDDDDGDGLLDAWEEEGGWNYNNDDKTDLDLYSLGARPDHKDIFVEVDWMDCTVGTSDCDVGDTHDHQPTAGIIEDGTTGWSCDDGQDNGGDGPDVIGALIDIQDDGDVDEDDDGTLAGLDVMDGYLDIDDDGDHDNNDDGTFANKEVIDGGINMDGDSDVDEDDNGTLGDEADPDCAVVASFARAPVNNPDGQTGVRLHVLLDEPLVHTRFMNFAGSLLEDPTAANPGPCNDGKDNGGNDGADGADPDCTGALVNEDPDSATPGPCNDNTDNGGDNLCDIAGCPGKAADPDCGPIRFDNVKRFGTQDERGDTNSAKILAAKTRVFHYAIFAHSIYPDNTATSLWEDTISGYAEMPGNDLIVALGEWDFTAGEQEGTFMHELGHNLGLDHGGGDSMNYKPNYLSVMNYTFQMPNIVSDRPLDYSRWVLPLPDNEDNQSALNTCNDNTDNGPEGACDAAGGCGAALPPDLDCQTFLHESRPTEDLVAGNTCDDNVDNGNDNKTDEQDGDCQQGLDEGRGIDGNMPPAGLSIWHTAYTYLRIDPVTNQASCPFAVVDAVGDIDWDVTGTYTGISLDSANTGAGISDPDPGPSAPQAALCLNSTSILQGYNDWANLKYVKGFALSPDLSKNDHFTPHPEPAQMAQPDTDGDGRVNIADNCPNNANSGQEDSDGDHAGNVCDNCPSVYNQTQTNTDGHHKGDACDADDDDDGWNDSQEIPGGGGAGAGDTEASDPLDDSSTPEVCDGVDNDGNEGTDEGFPNANSDGEADCVEDEAGECTAPKQNCDVDGDTQLNGPDADCDDANNGAHFNDTQENYMGTAVCTKCAAGGKDNDAFDTNQSGGPINVLDLFAFVNAQALGGAISNDNTGGIYAHRLDLNQGIGQKGTINVLDLFVFVNKQVIGKTCGTDY
jgi:hypothetical protein